MARIARRSREAEGPGQAPEEAGPTSLERPNCDYAALWCEENVARLLGRVEFREPGVEAWAVLISNPSGNVALLSQAAGADPDGLVFWDYHVIALAALRPEGMLAFDLDSLLAFPCPATTWLERSFPPDPPPSHEAYFRVLSAPQYLDSLASDRSHMRLADGSYRVPPPPWPAFGQGLGQGRPNNLMELIDMGREGPGRVMDRAAFASFLGSGPGLGSAR